MLRENLNDLLAFTVVAAERSFTRAAAKMGVSPSALSHTIRGLEERRGFRLLTRTTRSVSLTDVGEQLVASIRPLFEELDVRLTALNELREKPAGTIRLNMAEHAANAIVWPKLAQFLPNYPDIKVEITVDYRLMDIVEERYDAGVRLGESLAKDMIAVRISPEMRMAVVGTPSYFNRHPAPETPQELMKHNCINLRLPTHDTVYAWEFEKNGRALDVQVQGQLVFSLTSQRLCAALAGLGLAYLPEDLVQASLSEGKLRRVLDDWCAPFPGYYLYYPNRRQASVAFTLLVEALRHCD